MAFCGGVDEFGAIGSAMEFGYSIDDDGADAVAAQAVRGKAEFHSLSRFDGPILIEDEVSGSSVDSSAMPAAAKRQVQRQQTQ